MVSKRHDRMCGSNLLRDQPTSSEKWAIRSLMLNPNDEGIPALTCSEHGETVKAKGLAVNEILDQPGFFLRNRDSRWSQVFCDLLATGPARYVFKSFSCWSGY